MFGRKKDGERVPGQPAATPVGDDELDALLMRSAGRKATAATPSRPAPAGAQDAPRRSAPAAPPPPASAARSLTPPAPAAGGEGRKLIVGRDICLKGEVTSCDTLIVEGTVELSLTDARHIQVLAGGVFNGTIDVEEADIAGRFDGELLARDRLIVRSGGVVVGRIRYANIIIEAGGHIAGEVANMDATAAPKAAPAAVAASDEAAAERPAMPAAAAFVGEGDPTLQRDSAPKTAIERAAVPLPPRVARPIVERD